MLGLPNGLNWGEMDKKAYWVGFNFVKGIGPARLKALLHFFGDIEIAWQAPYDALRAAGLNNKVIENLMRVRNHIDLDEKIKQITEKGIEIHTWDDADYPKRLLEIHQPPPVLYVRGKLHPEDEIAIAVVGTRRITPYGRQIAIQLSERLAQNGVTVISGLARGVDGISHQAALNAGGRTIAVLGSGIDQIYPPEHRNLADEIAQNGAVVSDYALGTPPEAVNFPPRNRIISGLSLGTVVVEAGKKSGALITASFAVEQGREVFAVPGKINSTQSRGTNYLIQQGARPLLDSGELLDFLNLEAVAKQYSARRALPEDEHERTILRILGQEPIHIDEIGRKSGMPIEKVSAILTLMELKGLVQQVGIMNYTTAD